MPDRKVVQRAPTFQYRVFSGSSFILFSLLACIIWFTFGISYVVGTESRIVESVTSATSHDLKGAPGSEPLLSQSKNLESGENPAKIKLTDSPRLPDPTRPSGAPVIGNEGPEGTKADSSPQGKHGKAKWWKKRFPNLYRMKKRLAGLWDRIVRWFRKITHPSEKVHSPWTPPVVPVQTYYPPPGVPTGPAFTHPYHATPGSPTGPAVAQPYHAAPGAPTTVPVAHPYYAGSVITNAHHPNSDHVLSSLRSIELTQSQDLQTIRWTPISYLPGYSKSTHLVGQDRNSMFRATSYIIFGTQDNHRAVREAVVEHVRAWPEHYAPFVSQGLRAHLSPKAAIKKHFSQLESDQVPGDELTLQAITNYYSINLAVVFKNDRSVAMRTYTRPETQAKPYTGLIVENSQFQILIKDN